MGCRNARARNVAGVWIFKYLSDDELTLQDLVIPNLLNAVPLLLPKTDHSGRLALRQLHSLSFISQRIAWH